MDRTKKAKSKAVVIFSFFLILLPPICAEEARVACYNTIISAYSASTGKNMWRQSIYTGRDSPAIIPINKRLYCVSWDDKVAGFDLFTGEPIDDLITKTDNSHITVFTKDEYVFTNLLYKESDLGKKLFALNASTFDIIWERPALSFISQFQVSADGRVYVIEPYEFYAVDVKDGHKLWNYSKHDTPFHIILCLPDPDNNRVYIYQKNESVNIVEASTGRIIGSTTLGRLLSSVEENHDILIQSQHEVTRCAEEETLGIERSEEKLKILEKNSMQKFAQNLNIILVICIAIIGFYVLYRNFLYRTNQRPQKAKKKKRNA